MHKYLFSFVLITMYSTGQINPLKDAISNPLQADDFSNIYVGVSLGYSIPGGDSMDGIDNGLELGFINCGYRFSENWGATFNLNSSGHKIENINDLNVGLAYFSIGPMYSVNISNNIFLDIKPQYSPRIVAVYTDKSGDLFDATWYGNGFVFSNSLIFSNTRGLTFSINFDYLTGKWKEFEMDGDTYVADSKVSKATLGVGIRYNF